MFIRSTISTVFSLFLAACQPNSKAVPSAKVQPVTQPKTQPQAQLCAPITLKFEKNGKLTGDSFQLVKDAFITPQDPGELGMFYSQFSGTVLSKDELDSLENKMASTFLRFVDSYPLDNTEVRCKKKAVSDLISSKIPQDSSNTEKRQKVAQEMVDMIVDSRK